MSGHNGAADPAAIGTPGADPFGRRALTLRSFAMGGFEGATMVLDTGRRVDAVAGSRHDAEAALDYRLLAAAGLRTARDSFRWHLIEREPGRYDWSSVLPTVRAAAAAGVEVVWDLCHFGLPDSVDPWSPALPGRFAAFARAAARLLREEGDGVPLWCPVNEISYWAFAGGDRGHFAPCARDRGPDWKRQLVRMCVEACRALREVDPRARLIHADPVIHITARTTAGSDAEREVAERHRLSMFEGWDMVAGRREPGLGGAPELLDVVGLNFYADNQWVHDGPRLRPGLAGYRPLRRILAEVHARYGRPIVVTETGAEAGEGPAWLRSVAAEVAAARRGGTPVAGCCIYPAMDYPGWTDDRHCRCGPIAASADWTTRWIDPAMGEAVAALARAGAVSLGAPAEASPAIEAVPVAIPA